MTSVQIPLQIELPEIDTQDERTIRFLDPDFDDVLQVNMKWPNGLLKKEILDDGTTIYRYEDGQKKEEFNYVNGKLVGLHKRWYPNGQLKYESSLPISGKQKNDDDVLSYRYEWFENGQKSSRSHYRGSKIHGTTKLWHNNGQLSRFCIYDNGKQTSSCIFMNDKGILSSVYPPGGNGLSIQYYPSGNVHSTSIAQNGYVKYLKSFPDKSEYTEGDL